MFDMKKKKEIRFASSNKTNLSSQPDNLQVNGMSNMARFGIVELTIRAAIRDELLRFARVQNTHTVNKIQHNELWIA